MMKKRIAATMFGTVAALALITGCGGGAGTTNVQPAADTPAAQEESTGTSAAQEESADAGAQAAVDPKTVDYSKVDYTIDFGDIDTTSTIASEMWYGGYDGKVVKIDGYAEKLGSWSIMEDAGDGSKIGFGFELVDSEDYPMDGTRVELVGVIAPGGSMENSRILYVLPENMTVK